MKSELRTPNSERHPQASVALLVRGRPSPSPRPSPSGRGRNTFRVGPSRSALDLPCDGRQDSLSPGERAGVRGNGTHVLLGVLRLHSPLGSRLSAFLRPSGFGLRISSPLLALLLAGCAVGPNYERPGALGRSEEHTSELQS